MCFSTQNAHTFCNIWNVFCAKRIETMPVCVLSSNLFHPCANIVLKALNGFMEIIAMVSVYDFLSSHWLEVAYSWKKNCSLFGGKKWLDLQNVSSIHFLLYKCCLCGYFAVKWNYTITDVKKKRQAWNFAPGLFLLDSFALATLNKSMAFIWKCYVIVVVQLPKMVAL